MDEGGVADQVDEAFLFHARVGFSQMVRAAA
jgi:hypothetical protein